MLYLALKNVKLSRPRKKKKDYRLRLVATKERMNLRANHDTAETKQRMAEANMSACTPAFG